MDFHGPGASVCLLIGGVSAQGILGLVPLTGATHQGQVLELVMAH